jgi:four helix bundle protein
MQDYKKLKVWVKAHQLTLQLYNKTLDFPKNEVYGITSQLRRSAFSIPANIAEGCGKQSNKELAHFLNISLGSANETEYYLILAKDLELLNQYDFEELIDRINEIKAMLISLINKVRG